MTYLLKNYYYLVDGLIVEQINPVSGKTKAAAGLGEFFKSVGKQGLQVSKKMAKIVNGTLGRSFAISIKAFENLLGAIPDVLKFHHSGISFY